MSYNLESIGNICELAVKNCMTPAVYSSLRRLNKKLDDMYGGKYKLVLTGGSVFGIYFNESEIDVFKTHDFDIKFVDEKDANIVEGTEHYNEVISIIDGLMTELESDLQSSGTIVETALKKLADGMNETNQEGYTFDIYITPYSSPKYTPPTNKGFQKMWTVPLPKGVIEHHFNFTEKSFVSNIHFNYVIKVSDKDGNIVASQGYNGILIDMAPYTTIPGYDNHIGDPSLDNLTEEDIKEESRFAWKNLKVKNSSASYFKNRITSAGQNPTIVSNINSEGPLYYISLGYLLWDTVRMVNWSISNPKSKKLMRYLRKYEYVLRSLSNLKYYANCDEYTFKEFNDKCKD